MDAIKGVSTHQTITLDYEIELTGENGQLGLLQADQQAFRWTRPLNPNGVSRGHVDIAIRDPVVSVVLMTDAGEKVPGSFRVLSFRYALSCIDLTPPTLLNRSWQTIFPH